MAQKAKENKEKLKTKTK